MPTREADGLSEATGSMAAALVGAPIDSNGNLTSDGTTTYTWNARDQLTGLSGGASASFAYDGTNRRRGKTISGTTTNFLYDGLNLVQELTSGGTPTANLLTGGIDATFTRTDAGGTSTLLIDALGSALALTDASGSVQTQYTFEPFGTTTMSGAASTNTSQYAGRENDNDGLYYYRSRYYAPGAERFISEDPIGIRGLDINFYAYVENNPVNFTDPSGLWKYHGNWCGPDWTGGKNEMYDPAHAGSYKAPVDALDDACRTHDICYYKCRQNFKCDQKARGECMTNCDRGLSYDAAFAGYSTGSPLWWWMHDNNSPDPGKNPKCCKQ
jgi:RHS repeat-associated protein